MSFFKGARHTIVNGGNFLAVSNIISTNPRTDPISLLLDRSATAGLLDAAERFDAPKCDEDTRTSMLFEMKNFVQARHLSSPTSIYWLHGPAGVGKSALAQSLALSLQNEGDHAASFFFSRTAPGRNNGDQLIVTLACQLAINIPSLRPFLAKAIGDHPIIFEATNSVKMQRLIVDPINALNKSWRWKFRRLVHRMGTPKLHPRLILVDGLDECNDVETQRDLITCIGAAARGLTLPFRFIITSRPESFIVSTFRHDPLFTGPHAVKFAEKNLGEDADVDEQITTFLRKEFAEIRRSHPIRRFLPKEWPHPDQIAQIVAKSSKGFIYPATIIRYIKMPMNRPDECLERILGLTYIPFEDRPYEAIDSLYRHIFESIPDANKQSVRDIFHHLLCPQSLDIFRTPSVIEKCLGYRPGRVRHVLGDLLCVVETSGDDCPLKILHASLPDFLLDPRRSESLSINIGDVHARLASSYYILFGPDFGKPRREYEETHSYTFLDHLNNARVTDDLLDVVRALDVAKVFSESCQYQSNEQGLYNHALQFISIRKDLVRYITLLWKLVPIASVMHHISAVLNYIMQEFPLAIDFQAVEEVSKPILKTSLTEIIIFSSIPNAYLPGEFPLDSWERIARVCMFTMIPLFSWSHFWENPFDDAISVSISADSRYLRLVQILLSPDRRKWLYSMLDDGMQLVIKNIVIAFLRCSPYSRPLIEFLDDLAMTQMLPGERFSSAVLTLSPYIVGYIERVQPETLGSDLYHLLQVASNWVEHTANLSLRTNRRRAAVLYSTHPLKSLQVILRPTRKQLEPPNIQVGSRLSKHADIHQDNLGRTSVRASGDQRVVSFLDL